MQLDNTILYPRLVVRRAASETEIDWSRFRETYPASWYQPLQMLNSLTPQKIPRLQAMRQGNEKLLHWS